MKVFFFWDMNKVLKNSNNLCGTGVPHIDGKNKENVFQANDNKSKYQ